MATIKMIKRAVDNDREKDEFAWRQEYTLSAPADGDSVLVPTGIVNVNAAIFIATGEGKIQFTFDTKAKVEADTANWFDWDAGNVTAPTTSSFFQDMTAIRGVNVSGTTIFFFLAS